MLGLLVFISLVNDLNIIHIVLFIVYTLFILFLLHRRDWTLYTIIPLGLSLIFFLENLAYMEKFVQIGFILITFFVLHVFGNRTYKPLFSSETKPIRIDWYTITSCFYIFFLFDIISSYDPLWLKLIPSLLVVYYLYMLINRFISILEKMIIKTITALSLLLPYYVTIAEFEWNRYIKTEMIVLPLIVLTILLSTHTWKAYKKVMSRIQLIVLMIVTAILVTDALTSNTIYDAIILGVLSLASMISGMHYRIKAYFFVGIGVLLLNVLLQTKPYWGNFPWWGYLIIAGLTLIGFASTYELQKQNKDSDKKSYLQTKKEHWIKRFKDWE